MYTYLIVGNIFSFLSALCIAISVVKKNKADLIWWQSVDIIFFILSNIALFAYAALATNSIALLRNILSYKDKLTKSITYVLCLLCIAIGLYVNNRGIIGFFPVVATASYTIFIYTTKNEQQMRYALISNLLLWFVHDFYVQAYPSAIMDMTLSIWTCIQAFRHNKKIKITYGQRKISC